MHHTYTYTAHCLPPPRLHLPQLQLQLQQLPLVDVMAMADIGYQRSARV
jgi:hypothetical protein